ncbi:unnamed protein product [Lota lota]
MEEDDSQDELINKNQAHGKRKRATVWDISDDSDDAEDQSGEEEEDDSVSGEGDDLLDGEDEEDEEDNDEEEEEEEEEEEDGKAAEGAVAGTSADMDGLSSDEDAEKCPICLNSFGSQPVATPESCQHYFCLDCILLWSKNANSCPVDRIVFGSIYLRKCYGGKVQKMIMVEKPVKEGLEEVVNLELEQVTCEVCRGSDREDRLLLCDGCDAGYHMECLAPPLDAVPVEEWFCPRCEANNRNSRVPDEELSDPESLPARARTSSMRSPRSSAAPGPTRAIARTQQSERVRANVNHHRITQARTAQFAPTYMMRSTWLDDTINAVVAGLNTAVYTRDLSWRSVPGRRRKSAKRRRTRKVSSAKGQGGKASTPGVRRRRRKVRRKSRRKLVVKTQATTRSRIAKNLGMARPKSGPSLPSVYRPSEHTLGNMRADIGAASLSVYGDPYDLDPFVDGVEEEEPRAQVTSLLEAKRRGISHSALRSHQPVARPITAGLSRRGGVMPQSSPCVAEATPVPDLLGSILSGQSMLLMDSSAVVINRDGTLKAVQPERPSSLVSPGTSSSSRPSSSLPSFPSPSLPSPSLPSLPSPSPSLPSSSTSHSSPCLPSASQAQPPHSHSAPHSHPPSLGHPRLLPAPPHPHRHGPSASSGHRGADGAHPPSHGHAHHRKSASEARKAPTKAVWEDVSGLPRIPKIKREGSSSAGRDAGNTTSSSNSNGGRVGGSSNSSREGSSGAVARGDGRRSDSGGVPGRGIHSLAGDTGRQQGVDQTRGRHQGHSQRQGAPERAGPSSGFSNSFCPSSSSRSASSQPTASSSSSSSSPLSSAAPSSSSSSSYSSAAVSFRIAASGNSWRSRRLTSAAAAAAVRSRDSVQQDSSGAEDEETRRRQQDRRDKQKLLASRTPPKQEEEEEEVEEEEEEEEDIYDPFNPTVSDSNGSDGEGRHQGSERDPSPPRRAGPVKSEASERRITEMAARRAEEVRRATRGDAGSGGRLIIKREPEELGGGPEPAGSGSPEELTTRETQTVRADVKIKLEPGLAESGGTRAHRAPSSPGRTTATASRLDKTKEPTEARERTGRPPANSAPPGPPQADPATSRPSSGKDHHGDRKIKSEPVDAPCSQSTERAAGHSGLTPKGPGGPSSPGRRSRSNSSEVGGQEGRRGRPSSGQGGRRRGGDMERERRSRRSRSRDRKRPRSSSGSSRSDSSSSRRRKKRRPRAGSRSGSLSSSREPPSTKMDKLVGSRERHADARGDARADGIPDPMDRRRPRSRSKSRSREKEPRRDQRSPPKPSSSSSRDREKAGSKEKRSRPRSRSRSRERRKEAEGSSESGPKASGSATSSSKEARKVKEEKKETSLSCPGEGTDNKGETKKHGAKKESQTSIFEFKRERKDRDLDAGNVAMASKADEDPQLSKDIKTEKPAAGSPSVPPLEREQTTVEMCCQTDVKGILRAEDVKKEPPVRIKEEPCDFWLSEASEAGPQAASPTPPHPPHPPSPTVNPAQTPSSSAVVPGTARSVTAVTCPPQSTAVPAPAEPTPAMVKQEEVERASSSSSDEDFNVDSLLDNLGLLRSEARRGQQGASGPVKQQESEDQQTPAPAPVAVKSKSQGKRVTWNIQEPEGPQPEKSASITLWICRQYLKKLHMQERAIEEVKLAIKPYYQKRDITKDEYKEIVRKAVQKVCHSKSGAINPVKVANLVKAYVDKYKHMRRHQKPGGEADAQNAEDAKDSDSP